MQACLWGTPGLPGWAGLDGVWFCPLLAVWLGASCLFSLDPFPQLPSGHEGCAVLGLLWGAAHCRTLQQGNGHSPRATLLTLPGPVTAVWKALAHYSRVLSQPHVTVVTMLL